MQSSTPEKFTCRLEKGGKLEVEVEDRVLIDHSAYQYENGWWVYDEKGKEHPLDDADCYFLSESGILYAFRVRVDANNPTQEYSAWDQSVGYCVPLVRNARDFDRMIDALQENEDDAWSCGFDNTRKL